MVNSYDSRLFPKLSVTNDHRINTLLKMCLQLTAKRQPLRLNEFYRPKHEARKVLLTYKSYHRPINIEQNLAAEYNLTP